MPRTTPPLQEFSFCTKSGSDFYDSPILCLKKIYARLGVVFQSCYQIKIVAVGFFFLFRLRKQMEWLNKESKILCCFEDANRY